LSLYIDQPTLDQVTATARTENTSVSKLVTGILAQHLRNSWPPDFPAAFGLVVDPTFTVPATIDSALDSPRDPL